MTRQPVPRDYALTETPLIAGSGSRVPASGPESVGLRNWFERIIFDRHLWASLATGSPRDIAGQPQPSPQAGRSSQGSGPAGVSPRFAAFPSGQYHDGMSFSETIFLFFLALIIFGPKKLPEIARTVGKYLNEFRRASNEFKAQIEQEISHLEVEEKKKILPPSTPVQGTTSRTPSAASNNPTPAEATAAEPPVTLASTEESQPSSGNGTPPTVAAEALPTAEPPTSQESHV